MQAADDRLMRLAAKDILDQHVKFRELDELTRRIEAIEERLEARTSKRTASRGRSPSWRQSSHRLRCSVSQPAARAPQAHDSVSAQASHFGMTIDLLLVLNQSTHFSWRIIPSAFAFSSFSSSAWMASSSPRSYSPRKWEGS